jgi:hypothetical protein
MEDEKTINTKALILQPKTPNKPTNKAMDNPRSLKLRAK